MALLQGQVDRRALEVFLFSFDLYIACIEVPARTWNVQWSYLRL